MVLRSWSATSSARYALCCNINRPMPGSTRREKDKRAHGTGLRKLPITQKLLERAAHAYQHRKTFTAHAYLFDTWNTSSAFLSNVPRLQDLQQLKATKILKLKRSVPSGYVRQYSMPRDRNLCVPEVDADRYDQHCYRAPHPDGATEPPPSSPGMILQDGPSGNRRKMR